MPAQIPPAAAAARVHPLLARPAKALEAAEDPHGRGRRYANQALAGADQPLWARMGALAFLAARVRKIVSRWRAEQEAGINGHMDADAIAHLCAQYVRLTSCQLATTPPRAGLMPRLDGAAAQTDSKIKN